MTRVSVYSIVLGAFVTATALIIASISLPNWVSYEASSVTGGSLVKNIGLHRECSSEQTPRCHVFPSRDLCQGDERFFCSAWRSVGFLASFATIVHLAGVVSFVIVMCGGRYQRERGWPIVGATVLIVGLVELIVMGVVAYLYEHDDQFMVPGWYLDKSWYMCMTSALISVLSAAGLALSAYILPSEDGYDFLE